MEFRDYLKNLNEFAENHPELLSCTVVASADEDGNAYYEVNYKPSIGNFDSDQFIQDNSFVENELHADDVNAICIN